MEEDPARVELPTARIVDRDTQPRVIPVVRGALQGFIGAVFTMWGVLIASVAVAGVLTRVDQHLGPGLFDVGAVAVFGLVGFVLVRRIVRPSMLTTYAKSARIEYPSSSWMHAVFDLLWAALGAVAASGSEGWKPGPEADLGFAFGIGFATVGGSLFVLRLLFHARLRDVD